MKAIELEKAYNPKDFEDRIYSEWESKGYFKPICNDCLIVFHFTCLLCLVYSI